MSMEPGWYPDPFSSGGYVRWWDGQKWGASTSTGTAAPSSYEPGTPELLPPPPPMPAPPGARAYRAEQAPFPLATWGARAGARILDSLIEGLISAPLVIWLLWPSLQTFFESVPTDGSAPSDATTAAFQSDVLAFSWRFTVISLVVSFLYQVPQNVRWGRTIGKRALGLRIRPLAIDGPLTLIQAAIRWGTYSAFAIIAGGGLLVIDLLWPLWDKPWRQAIHDKTARTVVVPTRRRDDALPPPF